MKNKFLFFILSIAGGLSMAQVPQAFTYQAVARNSSGTPLANQQVNTRFSIHDGSPTAATVYQETDTATTNAFGLFTVAIGRGTVTSGTFAAISWATGNKYLEVDLDTSGAGTYAQMGNSQLLSVPYALFSANGGNALPSLTQTERDSIPDPALGLAIFNTTDNCYEGYGFGNWQTISCLCSGSPSAPGTISGNNNPCNNSIFQVYSINAVTGANSYNWIVPAGATIIAGQGTTSITANLGNNPGNIGVTAANACGTSSASTLPVTINTIPGVPDAITGSGFLCSDTVTQSYSIIAEGNATSYTWTVPAGATIISGQGTDSIVAGFTGTPGNLSVTAGNVCGVSSAAVIPITFNTTPAIPGAISGLSTACANTSGNVYSISPVADATTYTWTVPAGITITDGQGSTSVTVSFDTTGGAISVTAGNVCGTSLADSIAVTTSPVPSGSQTFNYTGGQQVFTVPSCVFSVSITALGAQGASANIQGQTTVGGNGGEGGFAKGDLAVTPGEILYVYVGGAPTWNFNLGSYNTTGGYNGGGNAQYPGGGQSDVRVGGTAVNNWVIVAGGGGGGGTAASDVNTGGAGGGGSACANGGGGGGGGTPSDTAAGAGSQGTCTAGGNAGVSTDNYTSGGGGGGGFTSGGAGSFAPGPGQFGNATGGTGTQGQGGNASAISGDLVGSGGGGGYYGGGGAFGSSLNGGGGGGSSWASPAMTNTLFVGGIQSSNGQVTITW